MPYRVKKSGYVCMYGSRTFVTKYEQVYVYLVLAEAARKMSGIEKSRRIFNMALETEKKLSRM